MKLVFVGIGLCMVVSSGTLAAVGHYDGVLGATDPGALLTPDAPDQVTMRVTVLGTPMDAEHQFTSVRNQLLVPGPMRTLMSSGLFVPVRIPDPSTNTLQAFLHVTGEEPAVGSTLVVSGTVTTYWPLYAAGHDSLNSRPVVFLEPSDYHGPILFKH